MENLVQFATVFYFIQLFHSTEELLNGFHKKWYLFKMPFWVFLIFEVTFNLFWGITIFTNLMPYRSDLMLIFIVLMIANAIQHVIWSRGFKKYVPGLYTTPAHLLVGIIFIVKLLLN